MFEPNFTRIVSSVRRNIGRTQSVVELKLPAVEGDVSKIFSVGARSHIKSCESIGKEVSFFGVVDFQVIYQGNVISAVDYSADFKDRLIDDTDVVGEVIATSNVIDVSSAIVAGTIRVTAVIEVCLSVIESKDINVLTSVGGDGAHVLASDVAYTTYLGKAYEKLDISDELAIDGVGNILMVTPCVSLTSVVPQGNYISISGKVCLDICYQGVQGEKDLCSHYHEIDFGGEVAYDGVNGESIVQSLVGVITNEMRVSTEIEGGTARMSVYVPVVYTGYVYDENRLSVIDDLYLEREYLSITCENFSTVSSGSSIFFKDNIGGTASVGETAPFIDNVLGVCTNNIMLASARIEDGKLFVEGVASSTVMYYTKETEDITATEVEMPFAIEQKVDAERAEVVSLSLENVSARSRRGKEIEVSATLGVMADVYSESQSCVISAVSVGDAKPEDDCQLYLYVARQGQSLWDVAKDTSVPESVLLEQNSKIELPIKAGDKLVIYKPSIARFE